MNTTRVLLLGKDGQVGTALQARLASRTAMTAHGRATCDLANIDQLRMTIRQARPDIIVNAAAYTAVDLAEEDKLLCHKINAVAPSIIAEEADKIGARVVHYSTDYVFDGTKATAYTEEDDPAPLSIYGWSKLAGDKACLRGQNTVVLRVSWVYGPSGNNFAKTILRLASERDELNIVDDQFGAPTSSVLIADVTIRVIDRIGSDRKSSASDLFSIFNLAPTGRVSWHGYALEIIREARRVGLNIRTPEDRVIPIPSANYPTPAARPKNSGLDTAKITDTFALTLPTWQADVKDFISHFSKRTA